MKGLTIIITKLLKGLKQGARQSLSGVPSELAHSWQCVLQYLQR